MPSILIENQNMFEISLRRFKRDCEKARICAICREKMGHIKPAKRRKLKKMEDARQIRRYTREMNKKVLRKGIRREFSSQQTPNFQKRNQWSTNRNLAYNNR